MIIVGCAGGGDSSIELPIKMQPAKGDEPLLVKVSGLRGGHSGVDIHEQRGNAIKILARVLWKASRTMEFSVFDIKGGDKHNAIPREAYAKIILTNKDKSGFVTAIKAEEKDIYEEIIPIDPNLKIDVSSTESSKNALEKASLEKLLNLIHGLPHGVHQMNYDIKTLVNTSTNLATIAVKENTIVIGMSSRSPMKSALQDMRDRIRAIAVLAGAKVTEGTPYPGWKRPDMSKRS